MVACCYKSTTAADRLFAFVELTSLVFNLHGLTSLVFNLYGLTSHVLPLCTQFSKLNIAGLRCFSDLSTQWKCGEVSSQIHGEVSQEYQNIDIAEGVIVVKPHTPNSGYLHCPLVNYEDVL